MVDIHCHLLPGVDDGAADWEECLQMARIAVADGIATIVATPHWPGDDSGASRSDHVRSLVREVQQRLDGEGIPLRVLPGHELVILPEVPQELESGGALALGDSPGDEERRAGAVRYALLETPYQPLPFFMRDIIFQVQSRGFAPVLAHPERNPTVQERPETLEPYVDAGCLIQVSAGSVLGQFGPICRKTAQALLRRGWAHVLASDGHSPRNRPPCLSAAREAAARIVGDEIARRSVEDVPAGIVAGLPMDLRFQPELPARPGLLQRLFGKA